MRIKYVSILLLALATTAFAADPAPGIKVLGPVIDKTPPPAPGVPVVMPGRFFPFTPADGSPSYVAPNDSWRIYKIAPNASWTGVKWDAPADAEPEAYSWPEEKGPVYVLLARNRVGQHKVQLVKNGAPDVGPVENGAPIVIQIGKVPDPMPPVPTPPAPVPVPPAPVPPTPVPVPAPGAKLFAVVLMDRLNADPAQAQALGTKTFRDYLAAGGHELEIIDTGTTAGQKRAADYTPILTARGVSLPAFVLMDADGATKGLVRSAVALPKADTDLIAAIKAITGK